MGEKVDLRLVARPNYPDRVNAQLVAELSWALREAQAGRVVAVAVGGRRVDDDGDLSTFSFFSGESEHLESALVGIDIVHARLLETIRGVSMPTSGAPNKGLFDDGGDDGGRSA